MQLLNALPRQPFVGLALAASIGIFLADVAPDCSFPPVAIFILLTAAALLLHRSGLSYIIVLTGFFLLHSLRTNDSPSSRLAYELGEEPRPVIVVGSVVSEPKMSAGGFASFLLQTESIEIDEQTQWSNIRFLTRWRHTAAFGDKLKLFGTAESIAGPRNPGEFDMKSYLARQDIHRILMVRYPENGTVLEHDQGISILRAAQRTRDWMQTVLSRDLEESVDVTSAINGMILGVRHQAEDDIEEPFQQTGTLHLFAVAGLHVGIIARLLWIVATVVRLPQKWATILIIPALLFYAAITGLHTSSVRAAVMSGVLLTGFLAERKAFALNNLAAAATMILCWNTSELFSLGFQLSFSVVAAIVLLADPSYHFLSRKFAPDPFLPLKLLNVRRRFVTHSISAAARGASVTFAAWIGSLPLMLWQYHLITPISLAANLVVVPIAFFVLAGGLVSMVVASFSPWLSIIFNNMNWLLTKIILGAVYLFAQIPAGHFYLEHPHLPTKAVLEVTVLDLKAGGALHLRTKQSDWLCDTGSERDYDRVVREYLRSRGVNRLDGMILTHGDAGHVGGAGSVLMNFKPREIVDPATTNRSATYRTLLNELRQTPTLHQPCAAGDQIDLSQDVRAKILFPPRNLDRKKADDKGLVLQLMVSGKPRVLVMSDSGIETEELLLKSYPDLHADIILKGQHYSGISGSERFLDSVKPAMIIATSSDFPESERIKDEWVEQVSGRGIKVLRQDVTGAVQVQLFENEWKTKTYLTSEIFRMTSR